MGSWNDILKEVNETQSQYDYVRRKYLKELSIIQEEIQWHIIHLGLINREII